MCLLVVKHDKPVKRKRKRIKPKPFRNEVLQVKASAQKTLETENKSNIQGLATDEELHSLSLSATGNATGMSSEKFYKFYILHNVYYRITFVSIFVRPKILRTVQNS